MKTRLAAAGLIAALVACLGWNSLEALHRKEYPGYRRMGIPLPGSQLAFARKGDHVDLLVTFDTSFADGRLEKITSTILQNVLISGIKRPARLDDKGAVELIVNPNEAQYLALSLMQGVVHILVRAKGDAQMKPMEMASFRKLFR